MRLNVYKRLSEIAARIHSEILSKLQPGDRLPAESAISEQLGESYNRVHRALYILINDGLVYSQPDHKGMIYTPQLSVGRKKAQEPVKLKIGIPRGICPQITVLQRACELFQMIEPNVDFSFVSTDETADFYFTWLPLCDCSNYRELDLARIGEVSDMIKDICKAGIQYGKQYALPVLHSPAVYWAHKNMLKKAGLSPKNFRDPMDFIHWGKILEEKVFCVLGYSFYSFVYHASQWGINLKREGDYYYTDPEKLQQFFSDFMTAVPINFLYSARDNHKMFRRGQLGMIASFLNKIPLSEKRFQLLGQPVKEGGYSNHGLFVMALGKSTEYEDLVYDFFRFMLTDQIQKRFFDLHADFSVIDRIYQKQRKQLCDEYHVVIPQFDLRGVVSDIEGMIILGDYIFKYTFDVLCGKKRIDYAIEKLRKIYIPDVREEWIRTAPDQELKKYDYYIRSLEQGKNC